MDYDKIILELLSRIQTLEDQMSVLMQDRQNAQEAKKKVTMDEIRDHIMGLKSGARARGEESIILVAREIHNELGLTQRYPMVCKAMRDCMRAGDEILFQPPKENSSTVKIKYYLKG